ncbi:MAG: 50S ribosomal protein L6 [Candidatus ainarchaeum sp.]|nr:50S ribosomal protein L6 [Candidatus ainarchaeum sp.]
MEKEKIIYTVKIPQGVTIKLDKDNTVTLSSSKGQIMRCFKHYRAELKQKDNSIIVQGKPNDRKTIDIVRTIVSHLKNMSEGLLFGYKYDLQIVYSHFPMTAEVNGKKVIVKNFLGEKFARESKIVGDTKVVIKGHDVSVSGYNLEEVSQTSTNIELATKVRGRDIRRFQDGIYLASKGNIDAKPEKFVVEVIRGIEE